MATEKHRAQGHHLVEAPRPADVHGSSHHGIALVAATRELTELVF
jgi:hypothetical protein